MISSRNKRKSEIPMTANPNTNLAAIPSVAGAFALFLFSTTAIAGDWPQFLRPTANGISTETGLLSTWPTNGPPLVWEKVVGTGYGAPSVRNNLLVLHHRIQDNEIVEAFDADTGHARWRYAYPTRFQDPYGYNNGP